jgi:ribosomal protein S18 acetylase RimI-like enzyme
MNEDLFKSIPNKQENLSVETRIARPEDWKDLKQIRLEAINGKDTGAFGSGLKEYDLNKSDEDWQSDLSEENKNNFFVLSWYDSEIASMGRATFHDEDDAWWINSVYVRKPFRGKIFPKKTFGEFLKEIKKRGGSKIMIGVKPSNEMPIELYKKLGFKMAQNFAVVAYKKYFNHGWQIMEFDLSDKK